MELNEQERTAISRRVAYALSLSCDVADGREILIRLYRKYLPYSQEEDAVEAADRLIEDIARYKVHWAAIEGKDAAYARGTLNALTSGMDPEQEAEVLRNIAQGLEYFNRMMLGESVEDLAPGAPDGGPQLERAVRAATDAALSHSPPDTAAEAALLETELNSTFRTALPAMIFYTMAKNGELRAVPREITLDQTAICVCHTEKMCQINYSTFSLDKDKATEQTRRTWTVTRVTLGLLTLCAPALLLLSGLAGAAAVNKTAILMAKKLWDAVGGSLQRMEDAADAGLGDGYIKLPVTEAPPLAPNVEPPPQDSAARSPQEPVFEKGTETIGTI